MHAGVVQESEVVVVLLSFRRPRCELCMIDVAAVDGAGGVRLPDMSRGGGEGRGAAGGRLAAGVDGHS